MTKITLLAILITSIFGSEIKAEPPEPEVGTRWILNHQYSDEFNGTELDKTKWRPYYDGWKGRNPGKFVPKAVSVKNGYMQIENGIIKRKAEHTKGSYSIRGGAVQSLKKTAHYGYYECKFKASRINMSTTFWMSNGKVPVKYPTKKSNGEDCNRDSYSQELDICESVGGKLARGDRFRTRMNFNTHFRYIDCNGGKEKFYSRGNNAVEGSGQKVNAVLSSESWEDFHIYAAHWKSPNEVSFYADNKFIGDVQVSTEVIDKPFNRPMGINMVTETYDWAKPYPTNEELENKEINTSYYDWVRSYELVMTDTPSKSTYEKVDIYKEDFWWFEEPKFTKDLTSLTLSYVYKANEDMTLLIEVHRPKGKSVFKKRLNLLAGYGKDISEINLRKKITPGSKVTVKMLNNDEEIIKSLNFNDNQ